MYGLVFGVAHISVEDIKQISKPTEDDLSELCSGNMVEGLNEHAQYVPAFPLHPVLGECRGEDFETLGVIGSGAYSTVYEAIHRSTRTMVALKVLKSDKIDIVRIRTEECLQHRANLSTIRKHFCTYIYKDDIVLVMEHVDGMTLKEFAKAYQPVPDILLKKWAAQLSVSLMALHLHSVVLIDLTLKNILITTDGLDIKVIDFGLAGDPKIFRPGQTDKLTGTAYYTSPENALAFLYRQTPGVYVNPSSDWYTLGTILFRVATNQHLYNYKNLKALSNHSNSLALHLLFERIRTGFIIEEEDWLDHEELMAFIKSITVVDVKKRLGTTPESYDTILSSPIFKDYRSLNDLLPSQ